MKLQGKQQGFTLIELVIVIVILGILAATAAPKFIDLQGDAKGATIQAVKASLETAAAGVHAKSLIAGNEGTAKSGTPATVTVNGATVEIGSGWPLATTKNITDLLDIDSSAFVVYATSPATTGADEVVIAQNEASITDLASAKTAACYATYTESTSSNTKPVIATVTTGC